MALRNVSPTRTALLAFLAGGSLAVVTVAVDPGLWTYWLAYLALSAFLLGSDAILGPRLNRLEVSIEAPKQLFVGAEHEAALVIACSGGRPPKVRVKVDVSEILAEIPETRSAALQPGENRITIILTPGRRGRARIEAVWLGSRGPLGLMSFRRRVPLDMDLPVNPDLLSVNRDAVKLFSSRNLQSGVRVERHRGDGSEFDHLREYVPGFDIRALDWKASARHGKMLCREMRAERNRQVILAIDSGRLMNEPLHGVPRLDHAINAGLTLAFISLHVGDWVGLFSFDDKLRHYCAPVKGRGSIGKLNDTASRIMYSTRETNFTLSLMELARRQTRRALVVVMTDFVDTTTAELMVENLMRLSRRHLILFVAMQDPMLHDTSDRRPASLLSLHRGVVAHHMLQEHELVIRRLRRSGIHCISALPGQISTGLIDRYLEFKRKEAF